MDQSLNRTTSSRDGEGSIGASAAGFGLRARLETGVAGICATLKAFDIRGPHLLRPAAPLPWADAG
jgi:hypothetical protein